MTAGKADVLFKAEFDATGAVTGLRQVRDEATATKPAVDGAGVSIKGMLLAAGGIGAVVKLGGFLKDCAAAAIESEQAQIKLNAVYKATGGVVGLSTKSLNDLAREMQDTTGVSGELVQEAQAVLLTFKSVQGDAFPRTMKAAADLSAVFGQDLKGSVTILGKALEDPIKGITAMTRVGVTFSEDQKKMIAAMVETNDLAGAQAEILEVLEGQAGETAARLGAGLGGELKVLSEAWGDVMEAIGALILKGNESIPILSSLTGAVKWLRESLTELAGQTEVTDPAQELTAHGIENVITWRQKEIDKLVEQRGKVDENSAAYTTYSEKIFAHAEQIALYQEQLPVTQQRETAAAEAIKRSGEEAATAKPKHAELGALLELYFGPETSYSADVATNPGATQATLATFAAWVTTTFPAGQAHDIVMAAATNVAKGDLEAFAEDIAEIVPPTLPTTAMFARGTAEADATDFAGDLSATVPPTLKTVAGFSDTEARADAGTFADHVTATVSTPSLAQVTAAFGDVTARGAITGFLAQVAKDFPPNKAAEIAAKFKDTQARGDVAGFLTYVDQQLPEGSKLPLTAAFVDAQARIDASKFKADVPTLAGTEYTSLLKADSSPGTATANEYADILAYKAENVPAWKLKLDSEEAKAQAEREFKAIFDSTVAPVLATGITDSILGALGGDDFSEAWKGIFTNLANVGASQLDTVLSGLLKGKGFKEALQEAGLMSSTGKFNWAHAATTGGAMLYQAGQERQSRAMSFFGGALSGAGMGASIGSVIPGIGTVVGAVVGAIIGGVVGYFSGGTRKEGYEAWFKPREDGRGMRFGMWVGNLGDDEEAEQARTMLSKYKKASGYFRDILDALGAPLGDWPAIEVDLKGKTEDFQTFWSTFLNGTLPRAVFDAYKPALVTAFADFGVETGRVNAELAKFDVMPFEEAAQALRAWVTSIVAVRDVLDITGLSFEDFKKRALEGTLEAWRRENEKTQADLLRWAGQLGDLDTEEQVEQAGKMVEAINRQIDANAKLLQTIDDLRQKYVASQAAGYDLSVGAGRVRRRGVARRRRHDREADRRGRRRRAAPRPDRAARRGVRQGGRRLQRCSRRAGGAPGRDGPDGAARARGRTRERDGAHGRDRPARAGGRGRAGARDHRAPAGAIRPTALQPRDDRRDPAVPRRRLGGTLRQVGRRQALAGGGDGAAASVTRRHGRRARRGDLARRGRPARAGGAADRRDALGEPDAADRGARRHGGLRSGRARGARGAAGRRRGDGGGDPRRVGSAA